MNYKIIIPGDPYPLKRPRRAKNGGMFDPKENVEAKRQIAWQARTVIGTPIKGPVRVMINFFFARPKSHYGKFLKASAPRHHVQKPDVDNLVKAVFDGFNGVAWVDDTQVVEITAYKEWADIFGPSTRVEIMTIEEARITA